MAKIFISYSSDDKTHIEEVVEDLESLGHSIWFDNELVGGQSWWDRILKEIEICDFYLCALSSAYLKSDACKRELDYANALAKTIIPIKLLNNFDERFLPPEVSKLQITDVEAGNKKGMLALINALNTAIPSPQPPKPLPTPPTIPVSYLSELLHDINSSEPLGQDQQAALMFKLRDHLRSGGDAEGVTQALDKLEARKDLLNNIGHEVKALRKEISQARQQKPEPVFDNVNSANEVKADFKKAVETEESDSAAFGFGIVAFLFPVIGIIMFFMWRKNKPKRAKVVTWAVAAGFIFYLFLIPEGGSIY